MTTVLEVLYVGVTYNFKTLENVMTRENMKGEKILVKKSEAHKNLIRDSLTKLDNAGKRNVG